MGGVARTLLLGLALASAVAAPAAAATWSAPAVLSPAATTTSPSPSVAINDAGFGIAAWSEFNNATGQVIVRTATHAPGGAWVSDATPVSGAQIEACTPHVSLDPSGNALVVWAQWTSAGCTGTQTIFTATRAVGTAAWSAPAALGTGQSDDGSTMSAASNASGQTVVGWETKNGTSRFVTGAFGSPTTGFAPAVTLMTAPQTTDLPQNLSTAVGQSGDAAVQWMEDSNGNENIQIATKAPGGVFQPNNPTSITALTSPSQATFNAVAIDAGGNVLSGYYFSDNGNPPVFASQLRPSGSVFQPRQVIAATQPGYNAGTIDLGIDATGTATAAWSEVDIASGGPNYVTRIFSAVRGPGTATPWTGNTPVAGPGPSAEPNVRLAVAASGAAVIAWDALGAENDAVAIYRPVGGAFAATNLGQGSSSPQNGAAIMAPSAAIAPGGDALVGFAGSVAKDARVAVLDAHPPVLTAMTVPATIAVGQPAAMTMSAADLWSGLAAGQPVWSFGDGTSAAGVTVAHAFATPGTYTVTLSGVDSAGNTAAPATRQIVVTGPAGPGGTTPKTTIAKPKLKAAYVASRLVGTVALSGTSAVATSLSIAIRKSGAKKAAKTLTVKVKTGGTWSTTVKLPTSLLPGTYGITVSGRGVASSASSFTIAAPKTGVASRVYASGPRHGPAVTKLGGSSELWAHFQFGSLPKKGQAITTQWILPNGTKLAANTRPRASLVEAQVKDLKGKPLPKGRWRCVLRVGGVVVATLNVRLT